MAQAKHGTPPSDSRGSSPYSVASPATERALSSPAAAAAADSTRQVLRAEVKYLRSVSMKWFRISFATAFPTAFPASAATEVGAGSRFWTVREEGRGEKDRIREMKGRSQRASKW